jgi:excinuclease UvrABC nuclease subunit
MVYDVIETIESRFKLRVCRDEFVPSEHIRPCLYHHIGKCGAPCAKLQTQEEYAEEVERVRRFLSGYSEGVLAMIEHEMFACSERLEFENAKILRDRLHELRKVFDKVEQSATAINKTNIILLVPASERDKTVEIFVVREGFLVLQRTVGRKAELGELQSQIVALYNEGHGVDAQHSLQQIDELRILTQWMYRRRNDSTIIAVDAHNPSASLHELETCVRAAFTPVDEPAPQPPEGSEYIAIEYLEAS